MKSYIYYTSNIGQSELVLISDPSQLNFLTDPKTLKRFLETHVNFEFYFKNLIIIVNGEIENKFYCNFRIIYQIDFPTKISANFVFEKVYNQINFKTIITYMIFYIVNIAHLIVSGWLLILAYKVIKNILYISQRISYLNKLKSENMQTKKSINTEKINISSNYSGNIIF